MSTKRSTAAAVGMTAGLTWVSRAARPPHRCRCDSCLSTASATADVLSVDISSNPFLQRSRSGTATGGDVPTDTVGLDEADGDDDDGLEGRGRRGGDPEEDHRLVQGGDEERPGHRTGERELPTGERRAPDDDGEDRVQLHLVAGLGHVDGHDQGDGEQSGHSREQPAHRVHGDEQPAGLDADEAAGLGVDPDGLDHEAERGAPDEDADDDHDPEGEQHDDREAEDVPVGDPPEGVVVRGGVLAGGDDLGDPPPGEHHDQGGDERLQPDDGDEDAVGHADRRTDEEREPDRDERGGERAVVVEVAEQLHRHRAGDRHDGPHGQVDPARGDDQAHAHGDHEDGGGGPEDVEDVAREVPRHRVHRDREVGGVADQVDDEEDEDGEDGPAVPGADEPLEGATKSGLVLAHEATSSMTDPCWAMISTMVCGVTSGPFSTSAIFTRSLRTRMRSQMRTTSSSSAEMNSTETPSSASRSTVSWISALAPTSIPRVGSSRMRTSGWVASHRPRSTFCWFPPERFLMSR